ncbi:hypothetical protein Nepgr_026185 [Nepenthes gracilis]|uniref:tRNA-uridine aminocarboxypropyltransferase n=1 Tax=Nepenthes gracilis TaxID=150966 RepID=A0AAD3Y062_NEPGR|nr:hypothetical protein Nepgr_026185 [Nepenthes gracilis]
MHQKITNQVLVYFRSGLRSSTANSKFYCFLSHPHNQKAMISKTLITSMKSQPNFKRSTCLTCSKPLSLCLCARIKAPVHENKVYITVLQHSLEKKHPLNSTRIATLGLKNITVVTVSDVNFEAQFEICPMEADSVTVYRWLKEGCTPAVRGNASAISGSEGNLVAEESRKQDLRRKDEVDSAGGYAEILNFQQFFKCPEERSNGMIGVDDIIEVRSCQNNGNDENHERNMDEFIGKASAMTSDGSPEQSITVMGKDGRRCSEEPVFRITIGKYGNIISLSHPWMLQLQQKNTKSVQFMGSQVVLEALAKGFAVKKFQKLQQYGRIEPEGLEEFEVRIPAGSAVLFPARNSASIQDIDFEVKNLIVLDGTWAKANRIYNENPWLTLLPCVRLNIDNMSMFSEVRHQPKPGYLSTIESIVYALELLGDDDTKGLVGLLDVFQSMVEDQRRCKDDRIKRTLL